MCVFKLSNSDHHHHHLVSRKYHFLSLKKKFHFRFWKIDFNWWIRSFIFKLTFEASKQWLEIFFKGFQFSNVNIKIDIFGKCWWKWKSISAAKCNKCGSSSKLQNISHKNQCSLGLSSIVFREYKKQQQETSKLSWEKSLERDEIFGIPWYNRHTKKKNVENKRNMCRDALQSVVGCLENFIA